MGRKIESEARVLRVPSEGSRQLCCGQASELVTQQQSTLPSQRASDELFPVSTFLSDPLPNSMGVGVGMRRNTIEA